MNVIFYIVERDFRRFYRYKWWLAGMISMNLADLFILALVYTKMVKFDYFRFFLARNNCYSPFCRRLYDW